ncbi:MAG: serine/threonine protein kinase, partial [Gemmataceae bacterium]|nr:serine/threonine protein kinase [Gemmataceae bacterium]
MTPQPPNPRSVFGRAVELESAAQRKAYLDEACAGAPDVRDRVEALLRAHEAAGGFLQPAAAGPADTANYGPSPEAPGTVVGPYKLLEKIGEGGMGEVWVADQMESIKRRVALKLIKPGMDSRGVLARFEAERQALAVMDHPNIAKVLDAGTTPDGRPYFVMELVKGTPITEFCDIRKLTPKERLELFVPVCQAIQHAHQKGVIHRDIKPSNVLVALHDEKPVPKVIDFGVAKAVGQQLTEKTIYTGFGALIGTPTYMAPEQATFNALDVDTRADVYTLGVLLYELLAGSPPIEKERLHKAALDEVLRIVRDEEPPRPSQRLSTSQTKASIAATRQSDPAKLSALMKGELDWIVMKALEKDRARRYDTATALAKDVQRYLTGDSVEACPPTLGYRLTKAYRKNRAAALVGSVFAAVLLAATGVSVAFGVTATRAEAVAERERVAADEARGEAVGQRDLTVKANKEVTDERDNTKKALALAESERDRVRRLLYASQMSSAATAFTEGRGGQLFRLLDEAAPRPGEPDMRGWEWHFLDRLTRTDREYKLDVPPPGQGNPLTRAIVALAASRDGRWIVTRRTVGDGFVYDVTDAATGRKVGQVP